VANGKRTTITNLPAPAEKGTLHLKTTQTTAPSSSHFSEATMNDIPIVTDPRKIPPTSRMFQVGGVTTSMEAAQLKAASILDSPGVDPTGATIRVDRLGAKYLHFNVKETAHA